MSAPDTALTGDALLSAVNTELVALHQRYYQRAPVTAKTRLIDDELLACVMGGIYTEVEKTMIEIERSPAVKDIRNAFQLAMQHKFIEVVERLSGRDVLHSNSHVGPDLEIELFLLSPVPDAEPRG